MCVGSKKLKSDGPAPLPSPTTPPRHFRHRPRLRATSATYRDCYHSFLAGSGSNLLGGIGPGGNPAEANPDQSLPGSQVQVYSETYDLE